MCVLQISTTDARSPICAERSTFPVIGERAKRARYSQVCSIENCRYILLASERSEQDTLMSVQSRIADIYIIIIYILYIVRANFVLITRKEGGA